MNKDKILNSDRLRNISSIVDRILLQTLVSSSSFVLMVFLLYAIVYILEKYSATQWFFFKLGLLESIILGFFLGLFPLRISRYLRLAFFSLLSLISIVEIFLWYNFHTLISPAVFQILIETNTQETTEFIMMYFMNVKFLMLIILSIIWFYSYFLIENITSPLRRKIIDSILSTTISRKLILYILIILSISYLVNSSFKVIIIRNSFLTETLAIKLGELKGCYGQNSLYRPIYRLLFSIHSNQVLEYQKEDIVRNNLNINTHLSEKICSNLVWIIGESCIKEHMTIYGYSKNTTPHQSELFTNGNLFPFNNVITPSNVTSEVFKQIFSMHCVDQKGDWSSTPLFPAIIKKSGFNVYFLTNQYVKTAQNDIFDFIGGAFINDPEISKQMFSYRNEHKYEYDEFLLYDFDSIDKTQGNNFYIFHLLGQHVDYSKRYPLNRQKFNINDYDDRVELTTEEKKEVMHYDNATVYNDSVLYQIIKRFENSDAVIIYMSDHGEEVYDKIKRKGRYTGDDLSKQIVENEFCVPFWIYVSPKFIETHKKIVEKIKKSTDNPYMIDNIGHLFLYLSGIRCEGYDSTRVVICDEYNKTRKRILKGKYDYDSFKN